MKKLMLAICTALLIVGAAMGTSCSLKPGDDSSSSSSSSQIRVAPVIDNKPMDNCLTITQDNTTYQFTATCDGTITWISTVKNVATISENGLLTLLGAGYTEVIARDETTGLSDSVVLTVVDARETETLTITGVQQSLHVGDAVQLSVSSSTGNTVSAIFSSNNPSVATVSDTGMLTAIGKGVATITAKKVDSNLKATLRVEVEGAKIQSVQIENLPKYGMLVGNIYPLSASCMPKDCADYEIEWSIDNPDIAVMDGKDNLIAIAKGECTITAQVKGTNIRAEKTLEVCELSKTSEDFRFATVGTSNVTNVGPTITFNNVDGELVEYGADQALKIYTRGNGAYNNFTINFGEISEGNYKVSLTWKLVNGRHSGAMVMDGESNEFGYVMATTANGSDNYSFYFTQTQSAVKKIAFSAQQWNDVGEVIVDDIRLEKVDEIPGETTVGTIGDGTFDDVVAINGQNTNIGGVFVSPRRISAELVDDGNGGKALKATRAEGGYAYMVLSLGSLEAGNYSLTLDVENNGYQGILQVCEITNKNGLWSRSVVQEVNYGNSETFFDLAENDGNTYTLHFSLSKAYKNFGIALSTNLNESNGESIILDNIKLEKIERFEQTLDFETKKLLVVQNFNGIGGVDFGTFIVKTGTIDGGYETEEDNTYYKVNLKGWASRIMFNFGTIESGSYEIKFDAKLLSGTMNGDFIYRADGTDHKLSASDYTKEGDTYTLVLTFDKQVTEFCIGYVSVAGANADFWLAFDNISIGEYVVRNSVSITDSVSEPLVIGDNFTFKASVSPADDTEYTYVWTVDAADVGTIDQNGVFTAKAEGKCTITVRVEGTDLSASVDVIVLSSEIGTTKDNYDWLEN